jgi:hypothetical protein
LTRAITGLDRSNRSVSRGQPGLPRLPNVAGSASPSRFCAATSLRSCPELKARSPTPVSTASQMSSSASKSSHASAEFLVHAQVHRVEALGPVEGDDRDAFALLVPQRGERPRPGHAAVTEAAVNRPTFAITSSL